MIGGIAATRAAGGGVAWLLRQVSLAGAGRMAPSAAGVGRIEKREFGRAPKYDKGQLPNHREWPRLVIELTDSGAFFADEGSSSSQSNCLSAYSA